MSDGKQVVALKVFSYEAVDGVKEKDEIFSLAGQRHDYSLLKFRHVREVDSGDEAIECDACTKTFATRMGYDLHLDGRIHPQSPNYDPEGRQKLDRTAPRLVTPLAGVSGPGDTRLRKKEVPQY